MIARLFSSGFELNSTTSGMEWVTGGTMPTIGTTNVRSGTYSAHVDIAVATNISCHKLLYTANQARIMFSRAYYRFETLPDAIAAILYQNTDPTTPFRIVVKSTGIVALEYQSGSWFEISTGPTLATGVWYRVELKLDPIDDVVSARVDGVDFVTDSGAGNVGTLGGVVGGGNWSPLFGFGNIGGGLTPTTGIVDIDDIAINDDTGSFQTSWPGEEEVIHLRPNAAGDNANFARGGTDSGANWSQVDEVPPNQATDFVRSDTLDHIDDHNVDATPAALAADDVINAVAVGVRFRAAVGLSGADYVLRCKASSGGTVEESAAITSNNSAWTSFDASTQPSRHKLTLYDLPGSSTAVWRKTDLDAMQIGARITEDSDAPGTDITALWALVGHKEIGRPWEAQPLPFPRPKLEVVGY